MGQPVVDDSSTRVGREGLSTAEVEARIRAGQVNFSESRSSRSWGSILRANVLTRFNALLGGLLVVILIVGPLQDGLFGVILVVNTAVGIVQEVRAKATLDRLALLHEPRAQVVRDGKSRQIALEEIVLDDVIELGRGDQIVADGVLLDGDGLEVDESLLSGEAEPVAKGTGELVLSGSAVVAGSGLMRTTGVGSNAFAQSLAAEAKRFSLVRSELQEANNRILRLVTWAIVPVAALLIWTQLTGTVGVSEALRGSVAGVANMIPEGLVLLTSVAYAIGALRLARRNVLVRELAAIEGLARVDVLCIDKTGTLTTGELEAVELRTFDPTVPVASVLLGLLATEANPSSSLVALARLDPTATPLRPSIHVPFSSARRWSGATFEDLGSFVLGAPEVLTAEDLDPSVSDLIAAHSALGQRVLLLARSEMTLAGDTLPPALEPVALGVLEEQVRPDAADTLAYLKSQAVTVKVISGDNPQTVAAIAALAGIRDPDPVDAGSVEMDELTALLEVHSVFGRVAPRQKQAMVAALQASGHVVAMTGDGVNDVLALRDADLGLAMGSGSPASRAAGRVVLLDNSFSVLPSLLAEGRRVLANVERVSKLFVTKTVYATLLAVSIVAARVPYPFYPRHFTVLSTLTIGLPAFFLALAPASTRLRSGYLERVARFCLPVGVVMAAATLTTYLVDRSHLGGTLHARTAAALVLGTTGLWVLAHLARPFSLWKGLLIGSMAGLFAFVLFVAPIRRLLAITAVSGGGLVFSVVVAGSAILFLEVVWFIQERTGGQSHPSRSGEM